MNFSSLHNLLRSSLTQRALWLLAPALLWGCAATGEDEQRREVYTAISHGQYERGVQLAQDLKAESPESEDLEDLHRFATVALYLEQGRVATFGGDDLLALEWFEKAESIAPESERVQDWLGKTRTKLARHYLSAGQSAFATEKFEEASAAYREALVHVPGHPLALSGLGQVTILLNYRNGLGEEYYTSGVRALSDYRLRSAKRGFEATTKYLPELNRAQRRATEVDQLLAEQRVAIAQGFEEEGLFAGALNEFRFGLVLDPDNVEAKAGIKRLEVESQAAQLLRDAKMKVYRHEFDAALELLAEGEAITQVQKEEFAAARASIDDMKLERIYQRALNFEYDGDYPEAVVIYNELLSEVDHYKDALARKSTLEGYVEIAASYYDKAKQAEDKAIKLEHLRSIEGFWPDYKDIGKLIDQLEE